MTEYEAVRQYTAYVIHRLTENQSDSVTRAALANLRRGIGHEPGELPQIWGEFLIGMPKEILGKQGASKGEWAVYTAVTLFALHQQGKDVKSDSMQKDGISFGAAANLLIKDEDDRERVSHRFYPAATADSINALSHHMRAVITLLRAEGIQLDYPMLAGDLYRYQFTDSRNDVRMKWGRDFCRMRKSENTEENENITNE